ncbi:PilS N terminal [Serratia fonticola]|uniref:type 4 pilus major pilin n=1 Tax=Serratia fonticola TaxID=47917 RepID=UPI00217C58DA|nr:type 4 pilus major pilin [Serratia fonticola]CAI2031583.1 PilS N terminal [Serratia fonticola]
MKNSKSINRGWLSLELTGVLLVIIVSIIGVVAWIGGAFSQNDTSNELANINSIMTQTRGLIKTSSGYGDDEITGILVEYGGVPSTMSVHGTASAGTATVTNVWGGAVTIDPVTISGTTGAGFSVTYNKVPQEACTTLTTKLSSGSMVSLTTINGTAMTGEVTPAKAGTACVADDGSIGSNTIIFQSDS